MFRAHRFPDCSNGAPLSVPETKAAATEGPMKKISDLFTDEEREQLSYLGSMLHQEPAEEEEDFQKMVDAVEEHGMVIKGKIVKPSGSSGSRVRAPHYYEVLGDPGFRDS
jgi:hypothetical protein